MVRVQIVRDIAILSGPGLEGLELEFGLTHVAVEIVKVTEFLRLGTRICIRRVEAFMVLDEDEDAVFARLFEQLQMVIEQLCGRLCNEHVNLALDRVHGNGEMSGVRREDGNC